MPETALRLEDDWMVSRSWQHGWTWFLSKRLFRELDTLNNQTIGDRSGLLFSSLILL